MLKNLITKIEKLHEFTVECSEDNNFSLIDKDIIMQNLRELYLECSAISIFDQESFTEQQEDLLTSIVFEVEGQVEQSEPTPTITPEREDENFSPTVQEIEANCEQVVYLAADQGSIESIIGPEQAAIVKEQLCNGDLQQYNILIRKLDKIEDFDNAMVYIYDQYPEKLNCEAISLLAELLTSKML